MTIQIINADCRAAMREMPAESVQCCVTSPPYWGLRDYGLEGVVWDENGACEHEWGDTSHTSVGRNDHGTGCPSSRLGPQQDGLPGGTPVPNVPASQGQFCRKEHCEAWRGCLGLEPTVDLFVSHLVAVFREVRRVLRPDGCVFCNLGDSYAGGGGFSPNSPANLKGSISGRVHYPAGTPYGGGTGKLCAGLKPKDLIGVPWRVAFALQADGWWLRSAIVWAKGLSFCPTYAGSVMPESCTDRPTSAYEMVFLLTKQSRYYYDADAVREALSGVPHAPGNLNKVPGNKRNDLGFEHRMEATWGSESGRNLRNVWAINPQPFPDAHFATFPEALVTPCVKAGSSPKACGVCGAPWERVVEMTPEYRAVLASGKAWRDDTGKPDALTNRHPKDHPASLPAKNTTTGWQPTCEHQDDTGRSVILDPFGGSGTVGLVAKRLGRDAILLDASAEYCEMARKRTAKDVTRELFM